MSATTVILLVLIFVLLLGSAVVVVVMAMKAFAGWKRDVRGYPRMPSIFEVLSGYWDDKPSPPHEAAMKKDREPEPPGADLATE